MSTTEYRLPKSRDWLIIDDVGDEPTPEDVKRAYQWVEDAMMSIPVRGSALRANCFYETMLKNGELHMIEIAAESIFVTGDGSIHSTLTTDEILRWREDLTQRIIPPAWIGGQSYYGKPMWIARERILFVTALIRIIRP